jgi:DNA-binding protein H-NS
VDPFIIRHPKGHTVPRLVDETSLEIMSRFLGKMEKEISELSSAEAEAAADVDEKELCI